MNGRHWTSKIGLPLNDLAVRSGYRRTFLRVTDVEMNIVLSVLSPVLKLVYPKIKDLCAFIIEMPRVFKFTADNTERK